MKKVLICLMLVAMIFSMNFSFADTSFSDFDYHHWAFSYVRAMANEKIINGYPDGTFKPDNQVKTGEFLKMASVIMYERFVYKGASGDEHWAMPYVRTLDYDIIKAKDYDYERLESYITRGEAVTILANMYAVLQYRNENDFPIDKTEKYIKNYKDEANITDQKMRRAINLCTQYELINGFEDGTFRAENGLTRAQAAKLLYVVKQ